MGRLWRRCKQVLNSLCCNGQKANPLYAGKVGNQKKIWNHAKDCLQVSGRTSAWTTEIIQLDMSSKQRKAGLVKCLRVWIPTSYNNTLSFGRGRDGILCQRISQSARGDQSSREGNSQVEEGFMFDHFLFLLRAYTACQAKKEKRKASQDVSPAPPKQRPRSKSTVVSVRYMALKLYFDTLIAYHLRITDERSGLSVGFGGWQTIDSISSFPQDKITSK